MPWLPPESIPNRSAVIHSGIETSIIEAILLRVVRGEALGSTTVRPHTLKSAAVREFGSWPAALAAAGLEPAHYIGQRASAQKEGKKGGWSKDRVRKAILQRHVLGLPLYGNAVLRDDRTCSLRGGHGSRIGPRHWRMQGLIRCKSMVIRIDMDCTGVQKSKSSGFLAEHETSRGGGLVEEATNDRVTVA